MNVASQAQGLPFFSVVSSAVTGADRYHSCTLIHTTKSTFPKPSLTLGGKSDRERSPWYFRHPSLKNLGFFVTPPIKHVRFSSSEKVSQPAGACRPPCCRYHGKAATSLVADKNQTFSTFASYLGFHMPRARRSLPSSSVAGHYLPPVSMPSNNSWIHKPHPVTVVSALLSRYRLRRSQPALSYIPMRLNPSLLVVPPPHRGNINTVG